MTESTLNQFAPPRAHVADAPIVTAELKLFSAKGRIGRLRYLAYSTSASVIYTAVLTMLTVALTGSEVLSVITFLAAVAVIWFSIITGIKRCHDINISGWWSVTTIVPIIALVWMLVPGSKGENRFGPPPPPNNWGVRVLGVILPVVFFIGILAAIAIPQYKIYTDKARAAAAAGQR